MKKEVNKVECFFDALLIVAVVMLTSAIYSDYKTCKNKDKWTFDYGCRE